MVRAHTLTACTLKKKLWTLCIWRSFQFFQWQSISVNAKSVLQNAAVHKERNKTLENLQQAPLRGSPFYLSTWPWCLARHNGPTALKDGFVCCSSWSHQLFPSFSLQDRHGLFRVVQSVDQFLAGWDLHGIIFVTRFDPSDSRTSRRFRA